MLHSKILIIEDSTSFADYLSHLIKSEDYNVSIANTGKGSIDFIQNNSYNLILLDMELPDLSGMEILKIIRQKYNQIELPVVFVSATSDEEKIVNALELGANDFISKPFTEFTLKIKIKNMLQLQHTNSELKQIYQQRNDIFDFSPVPSIVVDEIGNVKEMNHAAYEEFHVDTSQNTEVLCGEVFGCINAISHLGMCGKMDMCPDCVIRCSFNKDYHSDPHNTKREGWFKVSINKQIKEVYLIVTTISLRTNDSTFFLLTIENFTESKQAELIINQQNKKLSELNAAKDKFFSIIAHDLRSPFSSILGFSELLVNNFDEFDTEQIKDFSKHINDTANHTYKLLENLLEWARLQRGVTTPVFHKNNLLIMVYEICCLMKDNAERKNIKIENNIQSGIFLNCDIDMTKAALRNLMSNAIKFTNSGGSVSISAKPNENFIEIQIKDTGVGISETKIPMLFNGEKNISTIGTYNENGTGLGLLLCKELIEKQGGKIWIESEVDKGSSFFFTIPGTMNV